MADRSGRGGYGVEMEPRIEVGLSSDVGQVRTGNEDSVLCEPLESALVAERGLFCAVADGMGGHAAGEVASSMAVSTTRDRFYGAQDVDLAESLRSAIVDANSAVYEAGAGTTGRDHMGSTLTAAVLSNNEVIVGHVGDTRCYIVRRGAISQLTRDHSWVAEEVRAGLLTEEQARVHPRRNIITRALGLRPEVEVDVYRADLDVGNLVVICSDGLHGLVTDAEILAHVTRYRPADAVEALVRLANDRGGPDNISVLVAQVVGDDDADTQPGFMALTDPPTPVSTPLPDVSFANRPVASPLEPSTARFDDHDDLPPDAPYDDPATTPTGTPIAELATETTERAPTPASRSDELALDDDDTQAQTQSQSQGTVPAAASLDVDEEPSSATERRQVIDHLPTAAPRPSADQDVTLAGELPAPEPVAAAPAAEPRSTGPRRVVPAERSGRTGGMALIVVLLLLLALGIGLGVLLFQFSGLAGR